MLTISIVDISVLEGNNGPPTISGTLDPTSETDVFRFNGTAGQALYFDSVSATANGADWILYTPDNRAVASANITNDFQSTLTSTGSYTLVVRGNSGTEGTIDYNIRIFDVSTPTVPLGGPFGVVQSGTITAGETDSFNFTASAGQVVYFDSLDRDFDSIYAQLVSPSGDSVFFQVAYVDVGTYVLPESGSYRLNLFGSDSSSTGDYEFRLMALPTNATALTLGATTTGAAPDFETDVFRFTGTVGQRLFYDSQTRLCQKTSY